MDHVTRYVRNFEEYVNWKFGAKTVKPYLPAQIPDYLLFLDIAVLQIAETGKEMLAGIEKEELPHNKVHADKDLPEKVQKLVEANSLLDGLRIEYSQIAANQFHPLPDKFFTEEQEKELNKQKPQYLNKFLDSKDYAADCKKLFFESKDTIEARYTRIKDKYDEKEKNDKSLRQSLKNVLKGKK